MSGVSPSRRPDATQRHEQPGAFYDIDYRIPQREINAIIDMEMAQVKRDDQLMNEWIRLI